MPELSNNLQFLLQAVRWRVEQTTFTKYSTSIRYTAPIQRTSPTSSIDLSPEDEDDIFKLATYHNLTPWLWHYIDEHHLGSSHFRKQVAEQMRKESLISQLQAREVVALSSGLAKRNIAHLVFKGVNVQALFYQGFVEQRYCDDIDVLIAPKDLLTSANVFADNGYALRESLDIHKVSHFLTQHSDWYRWRDIGWQKSKHGRECLDVHWRIADNFTVDVDTQDLLDAFENVSVNTTGIPCMPFTTLFVYVCVHGHMDHFFRLRYLVDIYCAMHQSDYDPEKVTQLAEKWGVLDVVEQSINLANRFFNGPSTQPDQYCDFVVERFNDSQSFPMRSHSLMGNIYNLLLSFSGRQAATVGCHPDSKALTAKQRLQQVSKQITHRSHKKSWVSPIVARCKYDQTMLEYWPIGGSALMWYPVALIKRCFKRSQRHKVG